MCIRKAAPAPGLRRFVRGVTLLELVLFIVVVSVGVVGILAVLNLTAGRSADPLVHKQALAIAEAMLEEVLLQPFTYCDPDDPAAATALGPSDCKSPEKIGHEGEARLSTTSPFDNVNDYNGFTMSGGIVNIAGDPIPGLADYSVSVSVASQGLGGVPASDALMVTVTVTHVPSNVSLRLDGYRTRYAPNALP
jgi:MSHA pilin protein MshD